MKTFFALMLAGLLVALAVTAGWAQTAPAPSTQAPAAPATPAPPGGTTDAPGATAGSGTAPTGTAPNPSDATKPGSGPGQPGTGSPSATAPGTNLPATPPGTPSVGDPAAAGDGRIFGMSRGAAMVVGLVILAVIIGMIAMSGRRRTDMAVESRTDVGRADEPGTRTTYESEIERERRRRAS